MSSVDNSELRESIPRRPQSFGSNEVDSNQPLDVVVFLMNESSVSLKLKTKTCDLTANHVLNQLCESSEYIDNIRLDFNPKYKKLFSIWITSPYLELQLQPTHPPFSVLAKWDAFLRKHGPPELLSDPTLIEKDEPTLSFQRNVFCDKALEKEITDADIGALYLLYYEAKLNVLDGRYPSDDFEQLAAYQALINLRQNNNKTEYSVEYFRQHLKEYIPFNYLKRIDGNKINGLIRTLSRSTPSIRCAQSIYEKYKEISKQNLSEYKLLRSYLEKCWEIPCYGSAYFSAQIEKPIKSKMDSLVNHFDLEVWVAINQTGLHLISKEKPELLLSIDNLDLCWAIGCPESSDPNCIPCIYVQMPDHIDILQIFSRQFRLIETLLTSFIKEAKNSLNSRNNSVSVSNRNSNDSYDVIDGPISTTVRSKPQYSQQISQNSKIYKPERLSLAKFDSSGQVLNKTGSWVRSKKNKN